MRKVLADAKGYAAADRWSIDTPLPGSGLDIPAWSKQVRLRRELTEDEKHYPNSGCVGRDCPARRLPEQHRVNSVGGHDAVGRGRRAAGHRRSRVRLDHHRDRTSADRDHRLEQPGFGPRTGQDARRHGVVQWGRLENGILPWDEELLGDVEPKLLDSTSGVPFEQILALEPDVIIAVVSGITEDDYARLSQIAPTIPFKETAWATTWQEAMSTIGSVLGQPKRAAELTEETDDAIADLAANIPRIVQRDHLDLRHREKHRRPAPIPSPTTADQPDGPARMKQSAGSGGCAGDTQGSVTASREQYKRTGRGRDRAQRASGQGLHGLMGDKSFADLPAVKDGSSSSNSVWPSHGTGFAHVAERQICLRRTGLEDERLLTS